MGHEGLSPSKSRDNMPEESSARAGWDVREPTRLPYNSCVEPGRQGVTTDALANHLTQVTKGKTLEFMQCMERDGRE